MLHFDCDYLEGAHPALMKRLADTNFEQLFGYGADSYSEIAKERVRQACGQSDAAVYFLVGGTQANATVIDALLRPWQSVIAAVTGHISSHEAGAIESTGHKIEELPAKEGKLSPSTVRGFLEALSADPTHEHMPAPGALYISYPTEFGTLYSKDELRELRTICDDFDIRLFMDGARLGYGIAAAESDLSLKDIAALCDVFTIGGTKVGALFGEAVVFSKPELADHFFTLMKQHGAVLAKGRLLGIQFDTLFNDGLYFDIAAHAIAMAMKLKQAFIDKGYKLHIDSPTNQQFVVLSPKKREHLSQYASFELWCPLENGDSVVRFATSWATREEDVDALIDLL